MQSESSFRGRQAEAKIAKRLLRERLVENA
jgi:hypothetical protein